MNHPFIAYSLSFLATVIMILSVTVCGPLLLFLNLFRNRRLTSWYLRAWNRWVLRLYGLKVRIEGQENYDPQAPCLVVSNHQSNMDIPALFETLSGPVRMVAKSELFQIPIFGHCLRACEFIPVHREKTAAGSLVTQKIRNSMRSGLQIWVAPEGTRSSTGRVGSFKRGSFAMAIDAGVPIQPVALLDAYKVLPKGRLLPRPCQTIHVKVFPPLSTAGLGPQDRGTLATQCQTLIAEAVEKGPAS